MLLAVVIFFIMLLVLVLAHEMGHFLLARLSNIKVDEFAFGFPPRLFSIRGKETRYSFNLLPLGGFVKIEGEEGENKEDPRSFASQKFSTKFLVLVAGVIFNLILAYFLLSAGFMFGTPIPLEDSDQNSSAEVRIVTVQDGSPAEIAGLETGDKIISLSSESEEIIPTKIAEIQEFIEKNRGTDVKITAQRSGETLIFNAVPRRETDGDEGALGIVMTRLGLQKLSLLQALKQGLYTTSSLTYLTAIALFGFFKEVILGAASFEAVSGPVGIVSLVGDFSRFGLLFLIQLTALLSINLAIINLIPIPGLDGGRILFLILEKIKGSEFHWKTTRAIHAIGFAVLILLMIIVTYHDIIKLNL